MKGGSIVMGVPQNDGLWWKIHENPSKMDDLGVPLFQESTICFLPKHGIVPIALVLLRRMGWNSQEPQKSHGKAKHCNDQKICDPKGDGSTYFVEIGVAVDPQELSNTIILSFGMAWDHICFAKCKPQLGWYVMQPSWLMRYPWVLKGVVLGSLAVNLIKLCHGSCSMANSDSCSGSFRGLDQNLAAIRYAKRHGLPHLSPFNMSSFLETTVFNHRKVEPLPPRRTTEFPPWHFQLWSPVAVGCNPQGAGEFERQILQSPKGFLCHFFRLLFGIPIHVHSNNRINKNCILNQYTYLIYTYHLPRMVFQSWSTMMNPGSGLNEINEWSMHWSQSLFGNPVVSLSKQSIRWT